MCKRMWDLVHFEAPRSFFLGNNIAVGTKLSCHTYQLIIQLIVVDCS